MYSHKLYVNKVLCVRIEECLFGVMSSEHSSACQGKCCMFNQCVCLCRADQVPVVFSRAFLRCFSNNLIGSKAYLHSSAQRIAQRLIVFAGKARIIPGMQVGCTIH